MDTDKDKKPDVTYKVVKVVLACYVIYHVVKIWVW